MVSTSTVVYTCGLIEKDTSLRGSSPRSIVDWTLLGVAGDGPGVP